MCTRNNSYATITKNIYLPITGPIERNTDPLLFVSTLRFHACLANGLFLETANPYPQLPQSIDPEWTHM